jgi:hypothetical protein
MVQPPRRRASGGPPLVRLLAQLANSDAPEPETSLPDRLSQWLAWSDAITLSAALRLETSAGAPAPRTVGEPSQWGARLHQNLTKAITLACTITPPRDRGRPLPPAQQRELTPGLVDYSLFRQRCLSVQQSMETDIGLLRRRLRALLGAAGPADAARLAAVDAAMEQALAPRERNLLMSVPALLSVRFEQLRREAQQETAEAGSAAPTGPWLDQFLAEMQELLLAELDVRFQPVEGLIAALRACSPGSHVPTPH